MEKEDEEEESGSRSDTSVPLQRFLNTPFKYFV